MFWLNIHIYTTHRSLSKDEKDVVVRNLDVHACIPRRDPRIRKANFFPETHHMQYVSPPRATIRNYPRPLLGPCLSSPLPCSRILQPLSRSRARSIPTRPTRRKPNDRRKAASHLLALGELHHAPRKNARDDRRRTHRPHRL